MYVKTVSLESAFLICQANVKVTHGNVCDSMSGFMINCLDNAQGS